MSVFKSTMVGTGAAQRRIVVDTESLLPHVDSLAYLREKAEHQPSTADTYASRLPIFFTWQTERQLSYLEAAERFADFLNFLRVTPVTRQGRGQNRTRNLQQNNNILIAVRDLYDHLVSHGLVANEALDLLWVYVDRRDRTVRRPRHAFAPSKPSRPNMPNPDEALRILDAVAAEDNPRNFFIYTLLSLLPLRIGTVAGFRRYDLHAVPDAVEYALLDPWGLKEGREDLCRVRGPHLHVVKRFDNPNRALAKTGDGRAYPMDPLMLVAYDLYTAQRLNLAPDADDNDMLLVVLGDPTRRGQALSIKSIRSMVARWGRQAGVPDLRPHALRHYWASSALDEGASIEVVQEMLGHASPETTRSIYVHISQEAMAKATEKRARYLREGRNP
ncbi:tyrosine-type recombinase/integrase [Blastococcus sp. BMG 814]|uniref:Tyrosine-type recombinase/integrase n=1 Tax=Blastococcus carthaginiensis TaxID=3050034 RepID=A0ABT9IDS7_9ACTN|nr:tyrosine-type recombinase/integrase [Blastococcus carthaginiensis]MDP5183250.1 tyrosine-type recombinase/integrase [Blastococcus carthaginiensis]